MTDENEQELESSTSPEEQQVDTEADSTTVDDSVDPREGLLAVVQDAVQPEDSDEAAASQAEEDSAANQEQEGEAEPETSEEQRDPNDEFGDVPFNKHPRFQQLVRQRNEYRQGHDEYQKIEQFLETNGLTADQAAEMLQIGALIDRNPAEALERLRPTLQKLVVEAGAVLPNDLQEDVRQGRLTKERAQEISRMRAQQQSSQRAQDFERQQAERSQVMQAQRDMQTAARTWQEQLRQRDPDAMNEAAEQELMREITFRHAQGDKPKTADAVKAQLDDAWKVVQRRMRPAQPPKKPVTPVRGGRAAATPSNEPNSILDIVQAHSE